MVPPPRVSPSRPWGPSTVLSLGSLELVGLFFEIIKPPCSCSLHVVGFKFYMLDFLLFVLFSDVRRLFVFDFA